MKTFLKLSLTNLLALLLFAGVQAQDSGIEFFHGSLAEAQQEAAETNKLIFVDAYATWCGPCIRMAKHYFTDDAVGAFYNKNFINLKMDMEKGEGPALSSAWSIEAYPTLLFLDSEGKIVRKEVGMKGVDELLVMGKRVLAASGTDGSAEAPPVDMEPDSETAALDQAVEDLRIAIESGEREAFDQAVADLLASEHEERYFIYIEAQVYWEEIHGSVPEFMPELVRFIEEDAPQDPRLLLISAAYLDEYATNDKLIVLARNWTAEVLEELPYFYTYEFYASLQKRLGEMESAVEAQKTAIRLAEEEGEDVAELEAELKVMKAAL